MEKPLDNTLRAIRIQLETDKLAGIKEVSIRNLGGNIHKGEMGDNEGLKRERLMEGLRKRAEDCHGCQLYKRRTNLVFSDGTAGAKLMLVGEAPGEDEDLKGLPFVGRAGMLLTKIIEAIGLKREEVYIANVLKCRPPNNRAPLPEEVNACSDFLIKQIEIIRPKVICALGKFAAQFLLQSEKPISALRGRFYEFNKVKVMPTFHPAYLLRNPNDKKLVWEDFKKIRDELKKR